MKELTVDGVPIANIDEKTAGLLKKLASQQKGLLQRLVEVEVGPILGAAWEESHVDVSLELRFRIIKSRL